MPTATPVAQEHRLKKHIALKQAASKKKDDQKVKSQFLKERSKLAKRAMTTIIKTLEGFGAEVTIEHERAPLLPLGSGKSGFGSRGVFKNIYFNEGDEKPRFGSLDDSIEAHVFAQRASGYTVAKVDFHDNNPQIGVIFGKSICSADENFNGNIGSFYALMDALLIISNKKELESPLKNLFFFAAALMPLKLESPSHYEDNLNFTLEWSQDEEPDSNYLTLKADVGEKVKILSGDLAGMTATVQAIHGHGTVRGFLVLYEPAYEIVTSDGKVQARLDSKEIEKIV